MNALTGCSECAVAARKIGDDSVRGVLKGVSESGQAGQRLGRPRIHPFPARMLFPLAKHLIAVLD